MLTNRSAPPATITPVLYVPDVRAAVAWLHSAFGFEERVRIGESHRAQMRVGADAAIVVAEAAPPAKIAPRASEATHVIKLRVPDVDKAFERAVAVGARVIDPLTTHVFGERTCMLADPAGHLWELTQTMRDVAPSEWGGVAIGSW